ncbi:protein yellow-like [Culicoides brevitarsis]|uniref:protein yellow-like n=1 Tax=Culicoides brevitarsis TaxID=469753 RepID=UPI00307B2FC9
MQSYLVLILFAITLVVAQRRPKIDPERQFRVVYEWKVLDFAYPSESARVAALYEGAYIPQNNIISDVKPFANRLYVTVPRMLNGVPATLGYIVSPHNNGRTDPEIEPFPSWEMNEEGNCSAFQFVQGIAIDADGVMWVVDSGAVSTLIPERRRHTCPPKIVLLDLKRNGSVISRYEFPTEVASHDGNYLNKIVVDDAEGGFAYITDNSGADPGIVVYSRRQMASWKVRESNSMRAALNAVSFAINNVNLNFSIHIDGIALGPYFAVNNDRNNVVLERNVYYSPLSSYHLYSLPATLLRDPNFARASPRQKYEAVTDYGLKVSQTDGMIMDNQGILYFSLLKEHAIAQWDSFRPFTLENQPIIAKDETHIQWTDGFGFDEEGYLYVVINRLHNFVAGRLNVNEVNYRILRSKVGALSYVYTGRRGPEDAPELVHLYNKTQYEPAYIVGNSVTASAPKFCSGSSLIAIISIFFLVFSMK